MNKSKKESLKGGACIHFSNCNTTASDRHNERAMLDQMNNNIDRKLTKNNNSWYDDDVPNLKDYEQIIIQDYNHHQVSYVKKQINKKTGKVTEYPRKDQWKRNMHGIREAVVLLPDDSRESWKILDKVASDLHQIYGLRPLRIFQHNDEHRVDDEGNDKYNFHGHIVLDWYNAQTHKLYSLSPKDMRDIQDMVARITGMPRGNRTGIKGLSNLEYKSGMVILDKANQEKKQLISEYDMLIQKMASYYDPAINRNEEVENLLYEYEDKSDEIFFFEPSPRHPIAFKNCITRFSAKVEIIRKKVHDLEIERHNAEIQRLQGVKESLTCEIKSLERQTPHELSALKFLQGTRDKVFGTIQKFLNENCRMGQVIGLKRLTDSKGTPYCFLEIKDEHNTMKILRINELSGITTLRTTQGFCGHPAIPALTKYLTSGIDPGILEMLEKAYPITSAMKPEKRKQKVIHSL